MQLTAGNAEKLISSLGMTDLPLVEHKPVLTRLAPDWFAKYKNLCKEFIMSLSDSIETLAFMNLSQDEFVNLIMGRAIPENLSIRFRVPLTWGGKLEIDNLFMCKTFPHSYNTDRFIIQQSGNDVIWLPNPAQKIYLPVNMLGGGDGGNATEDRLTETAAAQIVADRDF